MIRGLEMENKIMFTNEITTKGCLSLHPRMAKTIGIIHPTERLIRFGNLTFQAKIYPSSSLQENEAAISGDLMDKLSLPSGCRFEVLQTKNEIQIGPFIGILAGYNKKSIKQKLIDLADYLLHYREIKGAIFVFCIENIDKVNHTVTGYMYNPHTRSWEEGTYPYPSSIIVMTGSVSNKWIQHFQSVIGEKVFNNFDWNRWKMYKKLVDSIEIKHNLPHTILYENSEQLLSFLKKHPFAVVKSIYMSKSSSTYTFSREGFYIVAKNMKNGRTTKIHCNKKDQVYDFFSRRFKEGKFIIQDLVNVNIIKTIHLQVHLIKNQYGEWENVGMFGKQASFSKKLFPTVKIDKDTLKNGLRFSDVISEMILWEIQHIALDVIKVIEKSGAHFATASINMMVDERGRIQLYDIEHSNPSHENALTAGYPEIYYQALKTNMLYTKKLAGFN